MGAEGEARQEDHLAILGQRLAVFARGHSGFDGAGFDVGHAARPTYLYATTTTGTGLARVNWSLANQPSLDQCVSIGRSVALPEAEQVEIADQVLEARVATERGHLR